VALGGLLGTSYGSVLHALSASSGIGIIVSAVSGTKREDEKGSELELSSGVSCCCVWTVRLRDIPKAAK
jgi:hypothetical protein